MPQTQQQEQQDRRDRAEDSLRAPSFVTIDTLNDAVITNTAGTQLGEINDLILDTRSGMIAYAVLDTEDVEGIAEKTCLVPYGALAWDPQRASYRLSPEPELIRNLPIFEEDDVPQLSEASWMSTLRGVFGDREEFTLLQQSRTHDEYSALFTSREPVVLRGAISAINREAMSAMGSAYYAVMIDTETQHAEPRQPLVLIAPQAYLDELDQMPQEGDTVTLEAVRAIDNDGRTIYVAKAATVSGQDTLHLRNDDGSPRWVNEDNHAGVHSPHAYHMASEVAGGTLFTADGEEFGHVENVVVEARSGTAAYATISSGGVLGIDDTNYAIPCGSFIMTSKGNLYSSLPAEKLKLAPKLSEDGVKDLDTREFRDQVRTFFDVDSEEYDTLRSAKWMRDGAERRDGK